MYIKHTLSALSIIVTNRVIILNNYYCRNYNYNHIRQGRFPNYFLDTRRLLLYKLTFAVRIIKGWKKKKNSNIKMIFVNFS